MGIKLKVNTVNEISKGSVLFVENEKTNYMCMIVKGRVLVQKKGVHVEIGEGELFCVADVCLGQYQCTYSTLQDSLIYVFPGATEESIHTFLYSNPEYRGIMIASLCRQVMYYFQLYKELELCAKDNFEFLNHHYDIYMEKGNKSAVPEEFLTEIPKEYISLETDEEEINYYSECGKLPLDIQKKYYNQSETMAEYQAKKIAVIIQDLLQGCGNVLDYIEESFTYFVNEKGTGLYDNEVKLALSLKRKGSFQGEHLKCINETKDKILSAFKFVQEKTGTTISVNREKLEELLMSVLMEPTGTGNRQEETEDSGEKQVAQLEGSLSQILDYARVDDGLKESFSQAMEAFVRATDRLSTKDDIRKLKKQITGQFYEIYEACMFLSFEEEHLPKAVELFLNFGYMDERLLTRSQLSFLCQVEIEETTEPCRVYTASEWLRAIYEGKKEPSRNEFDQDYAENIREMRKNGYITAIQEKELLSDQKKKYEYEVQNMLRYNTKVVNGRLSTFVPVLYKDVFYGTMEKFYVTKSKLADCMKKLEDLDFSVFYREVLYTNPAIKIDKEYVMKKVYPDMILMPVFGSSASMWQEISSKKRDTPARFLFPILTDEPLENSMIKMFGRYRWEYCRCVQGTAWNNIQYKSLTSEYMDYIQYYRKNRNLSEEKRNKVKVQIQRAKNNTREIFVIDYEDWMKGEASGAMKLNKVARELLATYCPFEKSVREQLEKNAAFVEAMARYKRERAKKEREYELKLMHLEKSQIEIPPEIQQTYEYYSEQ